MLARAALACALLVGMASAAHADRRPVAVVNFNLDGNKDASDLVGKINVALDQNPRLRRVGQPGVENGLENMFPDDEPGYLKTAADALVTAQHALGQFNLQLARSTASDALKALSRVSPATAIAPYADLEFVLGVALLGEGDSKAASSAFLLVHRLAPDKKLDDALLPEIVTAYEKATEPPGQGTLDVEGTGRVWIDGHEMGDAPGHFEVREGPHFVQLTGPDRYPRGARYDVTARTHLAAPVGEAPMDESRQIYNKRVTLEAMHDPAALVGAVTQFAGELGVDDIIFVDAITDAKGKVTLRVQTWQGKVGFSSFVDVTKTTPGDTLDALAPAPPVKPIDPPHPPPFIPPPVPLYQNPWVKYPVATALLGGIITAIVLSRREGTVAIDPNVSFAPIGISRPGTR